MLNNIFNWHSYIILNIAIILSYLVTRSILSISFFNRITSQQKRLKFAKLSLLITIAIMFSVPWLVTTLNIHTNSTFQLQPLFMHVSAVISHQKNIVSSSYAASATSPHFLTTSTLLFLIVFFGFVISLYQYLKNILVLRSLVKNSVIYKSINNIHLLLTATSDVPFCYSFFNKHYIVLPESLLENQSDMRIAIRHELQHVRQGDTYWSHFFAIIKLFCCFNPFVKFWRTWLGELQEYACDEALVLKKTAPPLAYADCLLNVAVRSYQTNHLPHLTLGMFGFSKNNHSSILTRRISMLFNYKPLQKQKSLWIFAYALCFLTTVSTAYAFSNNDLSSNITIQEVKTLLNKSDSQNALKVTAAPEVVTEINNIRSSKHARDYMIASLNRMKSYQSLIQQQFKQHGIPNDFLALPLAESGYQSLAANKNRLQAAGIWQFIPSAAEKFNLVVNNKRDDRLNPELSTQAATAFLNSLYAEFHSWRLAAVAYDIGGNATNALIKSTGSRDAWTLARSPAAPKELKTYLATLDATVIIMHNPNLLSK